MRACKGTQGKIGIRVSRAAGRGKEFRLDWTISGEGSSIKRIVAWGLATVDECGRMVNEVLSQEDWCAGGSLFIDCRNVNIRELHFEHVSRSASIILQRVSEFGSCKIALLATEGLGYGIGRQFQFVTESRTDIRVGVFLDELTALLWIAGSPGEKVMATARSTQGGSDGLRPQR